MSVDVASRVGARNSKCELFGSMVNASWSRSSPPLFPTWAPRLASAYNEPASDHRGQESGELENARNFPAVLLQ